MLAEFFKSPPRPDDPAPPPLAPLDQARQDRAGELAAVAEADAKLAKEQDDELLPRISTDQRRLAHIQIERSGLAGQRQRIEETWRPRIFALAIEAAPILPRLEQVVLGIARTDLDGERRVAATRTHRRLVDLPFKVSSEAELKILVAAIAQEWGVV